LKEWTSAHTRFLEEFNDLIDGKEMTRDNVAKYAKKARKILMDDDDFSLDGVPVIWRSGKSGQSVWATPQQKTQSIYERYGVSKDL
jgi:hypothetical protein